MSSEALLDETRGPVTARKLLEPLAGEFPSEEARLTAVFAGRIPARYALDRVSAEGGTPTLERLARQLPPGFEDATVAAAPGARAHHRLRAVVARAGEHARGQPLRLPHPPHAGHAQAAHGRRPRVPQGTEVHVVEEGMVRRASEDGVNGRVLIVDHGRGVTTAYCHNSELLVKVGRA